MRFARLALLLVACCALPLVPAAATRGQDAAPANDPAPRARNSDDDDAADLILLAPLRPLHVRLHITVDRQSFRKLWRERIEAAFNEIDNDHDGQIIAQQAAALSASLVPSAQAAAAPQSPSAEAKPSPATSQGPAVSLATLLAQLEQQAPPLSVREEPGVSGTAIFMILDADGDRRLSRGELEGAGRLLFRRDFNDDEAIAADELVEDPRAYVRDEAASEGASGRQSAALAGSVVVLTSRITDAEIATRLLERYDRDRDGRLSIQGAGADVGLDQAALEQLAPNASGAISADELAKLCRGRVDVEVPVSLGAGGAAARSASRIAAKPSDAGFKIRQRLTGDLKIEGAGIELNLRRDNRNPLRASGQDFRLSDYDVDGNGYLDQAESQQSPLIAAAFARMDADRDGKVFQAEFEGYMRREARAAGARLVLRATDLGQDLFDQLDSTPDSQLSVREILAAPKLLLTADHDADGYLSGDEIAQRLEWELARGTAELAESRAALSRMTPRSPMTADQTSGPKWFAAMDRNQDGDLSAQEFIGPPEAFGRLDSNHDGLIDAEEAAAVK